MKSYPQRVNDWITWRGGLIPNAFFHPRPAIPAEVLMKIFDNVLTEPERKEEGARPLPCRDRDAAAIRKIGRRYGSNRPISRSRRC